MSLRLLLKAVRTSRRGGPKAPGTPINCRRGGWRGGIQSRDTHQRKSLCKTLGSIFNARKKNTGTADCGAGLQNENDFHVHKHPCENLVSRFRYPIPLPCAITVAESNSHLFSRYCKFPNASLSEFRASFQQTQGYRHGQL